jgi:hypothetical protein
MSAKVSSHHSRKRLILIGAVILTVLNASCALNTMLVRDRAGTCPWYDYDEPIVCV